MKLYNKTQYPDELLTPLLTLAGRAVGAKTGGVIVKCTQRRDLACTGTATDYAFVYRHALDTRSRTKDGHFKMATVACDGFIQLRLPRPWTPDDAIPLAESIYSVAAHEFAHVRDYQQGRRYLRTLENRRKRHHNRPWEKTAIKAASKAVKRATTDSKRQDAILALALWLEKAGQGNG